MALKEGQSKLGVRFRFHKSRKHGALRDKYWSIRHTVDGKQIEEGLGWSSEEMTELKAFAIASEFKENKKRGKRPQSMRDKRFALEEQERKDAEALQDDKDANQPFNTFFMQFIKDREKEGRPHEEITRHLSNYKKYVESTIGEMLPRKIKVINFKGIVRKMEKGGLSPRMIKGVIGLIGQVYNHNIAHNEYSYSNPVNRKTILPSRVKSHSNRRERYLSVEEANLLLDTLPEPVKTMSILSLQMGFRAGEILKLKWADVNKDRISIRDTKNGRPRSLVMTVAVKNAIGAISRGKNNEVVFTHTNPPTPMKEIPRIFSKAVNNLGFNDDIEDRRQKVVFHTLRHTCASWLVRAGIDLYTVKEVLGHSSITVTERYVHEGAKFNEAASVMDNLFTAVEKKGVANGSQVFENAN